RRDVLVAAEDVRRVVASLECPQALERLVAEGGAHALDRLVRLHVVDVAAAERPRLERGGGVTSPGDLLVVERGVLPGRGRADVEGGVPEAEGARGRVGVLRAAVERLDQDPSGG